MSSVQDTLGRSEGIGEEEGLVGLADGVGEGDLVGLADGVLSELVGLMDGLPEGVLVGGGVTSGQKPHDSGQLPPTSKPAVGAASSPRPQY